MDIEKLRNAIEDAGFVFVRFDDNPDSCFDEGVCVVRRKIEKPKEPEKIERIDKDGPLDGTDSKIWVDLIEFKVNQLIDAVNELRKK